jgi:hypothetical protein
MEAPDPLWVIAALRDEIRCLHQYCALLEWQNKYLNEQLVKADLHCELLQPTRH